MIEPLTLPDFCWSEPPTPSAADYHPPLCQPPAVPPPTDGILVINVCDFLAAVCDPMPPADQMREALRLAAESVPDEGGILYFPEGIYEIATHACSPIAIKSNTWIRGAGSTKTVLRWTHTSGLLLWCYAVDNVRISNLGFDLNHGVCDLPNNQHTFNFTTAIATGAAVLEDGEIRRSKNIVIEDCEFYTSGEPVPGQTLHAVLAQGVDGLWIRRNRLHRVQIKAAGWQGCTRAYIQDNFISDPYNLGISMVVQTHDGTINDAYITGNVIENLPSAGGIFIGTDGERTPGEGCRRIVIRDNIVRGTFHGLIPSDWKCDGSNASVGSSVAFIINIPKNSSDWIVENNIVENTSAVIASNTVGISIRASEGHSQIERLIVRGNSVRNVDQYGILVGVSGKNIVIADNRCENTRGIYLFGGPLDTREVVVSGNVITGSSSGVYASAINGSLTGVIICDNMLESDPAGGTWWVGIRLETGDVHVLSASVVGNRCRAQGVFSYASWGIREEKLAGDGELIDMAYLDNDLRGATVPIELVDQRAIVRHNRGFRTENRGSGAIAPGAYYADVAHGLSQRPRAEHIKITATSSWGATRSLTWIEIPDATHIRVRCAVPPVAPQTFDFVWRARIR